ncbi:putative mitochondrial fatty acid elongase [Leptomonas pyrrhocoris]|uniref:Elongation of fatty acids protein n=1 Tax=Leptomonas pyrrhocoris TaxID=157538 RepID=A0A0M9FW29_LEPPY|nr:putative mitochondrial fatty acid elongase [Leptomonas pyrrhocoris]KPA77255.1 putative mitochondrial fatty acid elongase [Leptomonas pyrrhocoris]|eukprot:XP_015655694.1 putative mitochondrial fatty acid elongase [Leptomonas pyrrhocoris]
MMTMISGFVAWAKAWIETPANFKGSSARNFLDAAPDYPCYAALLYIVAVFFLPSLIERRGWTFDMKYGVAAWNLALSVVSTLGSYYCLQNLYDTIFHEKGFHKTCCAQLTVRHTTAFASHTIRNDYYDPSADGAFDAANIHRHNPHIATYTHQLLDKNYDGPRAFYTALFMYLKTPELLDTLFLILQNKPVSFLHWYHHIVTAIYCWHASYVLIPSGIIFSTMNYFVHSIMYFYYFLVVMGLRKTIRPFAPVITLLQVVQMFIGMYVTTYTYFQHWLAPEQTGTWFYLLCEAVLTAWNCVAVQAKSLFSTGALASSVPPYVMSDHFWGCDSDPTNMRMGMMMYGSYCVLFAVLFKELYLDPREHKNSLVLGNKEAKKSKAQNGKAEVVSGKTTEAAQPLKKKG